MINFEELKKKLDHPMDDKNQEASMISMIDVNCKVPQELSGFLTDFLHLETSEEDAVNELFKLTPDQITTVATLAMIANGRVADFIRLERNMIVLKLSVTDYIRDNIDYRNTSLDENKDNPEAMLDAMIKMKEIIKRARR
jgi:hypothetical protein